MSLTERKIQCLKIKTLGYSDVPYYLKQFADLFKGS